MITDKAKREVAEKALAAAGFNINVEGADTGEASKLRNSLVDFIHNTPPSKRNDAILRLADAFDKHGGKTKLSGTGIEDLKTEAERDAAQKIVETLEPLSEQDRKKTLSALNKRLAELDSEHAAATAEFNALQDLRDWSASGNLSLAQPQGSAWYKLRESWKRKAVLNGTTDDRDQAKYFASEPHVIVVEHDWAKAFKGSGDFDTGEFHLPFPRCCFEFQMGGRRVCAMLIEGDDGVTLRPYIQSQGFWISGLEYRHGDGEWYTDDGVAADADESIAYEISRQVRAVSIALEADAVEQEEQVQSDKVNAHRIKQGKPPFNSFHTIRIAAHRRARRIASEHDPRWRVRLHFRRGHWRHYANHKTWVKWMLVGDPDLGFVNKHYRL